MSSLLNSNYDQQRRLTKPLYKPFKAPGQRGGVISKKLPYWKGYFISGFHTGYDSAWCAIDVMKGHNWKIPKDFSKAFHVFPGLWQKHCQNMMYFPKEMVFGSNFALTKDSYDSWPMFLAGPKDLTYLIQLSWKYLTTDEFDRNHIIPLRRMGYHELS